MSIPVDLTRLAETLTSFGPGYLLTSSADGRVKAVSVLPVLRDGVLICSGPGRGSCANVTVHPTVTLLYPPMEPGGHSLLVDGTGILVDESVRVTPHRAVLHRPAG